MANTDIKICGLSTPETIDAAVDAGATHIGLVHFEPSPRHVSAEVATALRRRVPLEVKVVLLTVNMQPVPLAELVDKVQPDIVQFHGNETAEWLGLLRENTQLTAWKALGIADATGLEKARKFVGKADRLIYDAPAGKLPGGNGVALDWDLLGNYAHIAEWGLAGGLTPGNVADAIARTGAPLVDTSSGVESAPGVKDAGLIRAFCAAVRGA